LKDYLSAGTLATVLSIFAIVSQSTFPVTV
jgi:hypothetical protein